MKQLGRNVLLVMSVLSGAWSAAWAEQRVTVTDNTPIPIEVSAQGMTVIKFPNPVAKVYSSMKQVAIEPAGLNVVVSKVTEVGDLVVLTNDDTAYTFQLAPVKVVAQAVVIDDVRKAEVHPQDDVIVKQSSGFVSQLVNLVKAFGGGTVPRGYEARTQDEASRFVPSWVGLEIESVKVFDGPAYTVLLLSLRNDSTTEHTFHGWEWNGPKVLGVSMNRDHVLPGEVASILVFRERSKQTKDAHVEG